MVLVGNDDCDESLDNGEQSNRTRAIVSDETASILASHGEGPLDVRIKRLAEERDELQVISCAERKKIGLILDGGFFFNVQEALRHLKLNLEEEKSRNESLDRTPFTPETVTDGESKKLLEDYKFRMQKSEQDLTTLQSTVRSNHELLHCFCLFAFPTNKRPGW